MLNAPDFIGPAGTHCCPFLLFYFLLVVVTTSVIALPSGPAVLLTCSDLFILHFCWNCCLRPPPVDRFTWNQPHQPLPLRPLLLSKRALAAPFVFLMSCSPDGGLVTCCPNAWKLEFAWKTCLKEGSVFRLICKKNGPGLKSGMLLFSCGFQVPPIGGCV